MLFITILLYSSQAQTQLEWINRTGTIADSIFNSRVYFHPDHFYGPITQYKNFPYDQYDDEFEIYRLKIRHNWYQKLFNSIWQTGFLLQLPVKAEGQTEINSITLVGKYDFEKQYFPLKFQKQAVDFELMNDEVDFEKLYKQTKIKEPKYTDLGRVIFRLQPIEIPLDIEYLHVPSKYAESFKSSVTYGLIGIELIIEFESKSKYYTQQVEKEHFIEFKKEYNIAGGIAKEKYLKMYKKPLELLHIIELKYKILGYRIVDGDHLVLFESCDKSVKSVDWKQDSLNTNKEDYILMKEKLIESSLVPISTNPWFHDAIVKAYKIENKPTLIENKFHSWWECDLYIKLLGKRIPSIIELREFLLQYNPSETDKHWNEITSTRGYYNSESFRYLNFIFDYSEENPSKYKFIERTNDYGRRMSYYNDGFWSNYWESKFRGITQ